MNGFLAGVGEYGSPRFLGVTLFVTPHLHQRRYQRVVALPDRFFVRFFGVALPDAFLSRLCCAFRLWVVGLACRCPLPFAFFTWVSEVLGSTLIRLAFCCSSCAFSSRVFSSSICRALRWLVARSAFCCASCAFSSTFLSWASKALLWLVRFAFCCVSSAFSSCAFWSLVSRTRR